MARCERSDEMRNTRSEVVNTECAAVQYHKRRTQMKEQKLKQVCKQHAFR